MESTAVAEDAALRIAEETALLRKRQLQAVAGAAARTAPK